MDNKRILKEMCVGNSHGLSGHWLLYYDTVHIILFLLARCVQILRQMVC